MEENKPKQKIKKRVVWIILNLIQIIIIVFLIFQNKNSKNEVDSVKVELKASETEHKNVTLELLSIREKLLDQKKQMTACHLFVHLFDPG